MTSTPEDRSVDRAALLGTSLAAVVALTFGGQGPWEWLASVVGLALLAVLLGFFRFPADGRALPRELLALAAVGALCATLVVAAPLQALLAVATPLGGTCTDVAAVAAAAATSVGAGVAPSVARSAATQAADTAYGDCLGTGTNRWLWAPAVGFTALGHLVVTVLGRRRHTGTGAPARDADSSA